MLRLQQKNGRKPCRAEQADVAGKALNRGRAGEIIKDVAHFPGQLAAGTAGRISEQLLLRAAVEQVRIVLLCGVCRRGDHQQCFLAACKTHRVELRFFSHHAADGLREYGAQGTRQSIPHAGCRAFWQAAPAVELPHRKAPRRGLFQPLEHPIQLRLNAIGIFARNGLVEQCQYIGHAGHTAAFGGHEATSDQAREQLLCLDLPVIIHALADGHIHHGCRQCLDVRVTLDGSNGVVAEGALLGVCRIQDVHRVVFALEVLCHKVGVPLFCIAQDRVAAVHPGHCGQDHASTFAAAGGAHDQCICVGASAAHLITGQHTAFRHNKRISFHRTLLYTRSTTRSQIPKATASSAFMKLS